MQGLHTFIDTYIRAYGVVGLHDSLTTRSWISVLYQWSIGYKDWIAKAAYKLRKPRAVLHSLLCGDLWLLARYFFMLRLVLYFVVVFKLCWFRSVWRSVRLSWTGMKLVACVFILCLFASPLPPCDFNRLRRSVRRRLKGVGRWMWGRGANIRIFTKGGANLKKIMVLRPKLRV